MDWLSAFKYVLKPMIKKNHQYFSFIEKRSCILLSIESNGKPLAAIIKFPNAFGKLIIGTLLATNEGEVSNTMIGDDVLAIIGNH